MDILLEKLVELEGQGEIYVRVEGETATVRVAGGTILVEHSYIDDPDFTVKFYGLPEDYDGDYFITFIYNEESDKLNAKYASQEEIAAMQIEVNNLMP